MTTASSGEKDKNRGIVITFLFVLICFSLLLSFFSSKGPSSGSSSSGTVALENKINPNTASEASLTRLPGIGPAKAKQIITYRNNFLANGKIGPAFISLSDLDKVPGIGQGTIKDFNGLLKFD